MNDRACVDGKTHGKGFIENHADSAHSDGVDCKPSDTKEIWSEIQRVLRKSITAW